MFRTSSFGPPCAARRYAERIGAAPGHSVRGTRAWALRAKCCDRWVAVRSPLAAPPDLAATLRGGAADAQFAGALGISGVAMWTMVSFENDNARTESPCQFSMRSE